MTRRLAALVAAIAMLVTAVAPGVARVNPATPAAAPAPAPAAPASATDPTKVPHYFGPYSNWANSPQVLADAIVSIGVGVPTPAAYGNPLVGRAYATDFASVGTGTAASVSPIAATSYNVSAGSATGGTFKLTVDGTATVPLAWDAAAGTVQAALTGATVTGSGSTGPWVVTFSTAPALFTIDGAGLTKAVADAAATAGTGVWNVTAGSATGGTFALTVDGTATAPVAWNAAAGAVELALGGAGVATVTGTGTILVPWVVTFVTAPGSVTMDGALLTQGVADASAAATAGASYTVSAGSATGGTFTLIVNAGTPTAGIAWNATAADVQTALGGPSVATVTGTSPWVVTFATAPTTFTIDGTGLTGAVALAPVFVVLPGAPLPAGSLQSFQTWNQGNPGGSPGPSAGNAFRAYVLRPTGTANQYTVVYDAGTFTVPVPTNSAGEVATFPVTPAVTVNAGDVIGFYGQGIPVDNVIATNQDTFSYPAPVAPALSSTVGVGIDAGFPLFATQDRTYSFAATVLPTVVDPGTAAQATATVDPKTGGVSAITVTSPGSGYAVPPSVTITSPGVVPSAPASATAVISTGVVTSVTVAESGFGFTAPTVTFTGGNPTSGFTATGVASGGVDNVSLASGGGPYTAQPIVKFDLPNLPGGIQATGTATMNASGVVTAVDVVNAGSGYTSAPGVTIIDAGQTPVAIPAVAVATINILQIDVTSGGKGYDSAPTVTIADTVGTADKGASAIATVAVLGAVTAITVTAQGAGYLTPGLKKFVDTLPGLGPTAANNYGQYIPVAVPDTTTYPGSDYYEIAVVQYRQQFSSQLPPTLLRGYVQLSTSVVPGNSVPLSNANLTGGVTPIAGYTGVDNPHYLGPTIVATKDRPVRILFRNLLPTGVAGDLFLPVDTSLMGSGPGPNAMTLDANGVPMDMAADNGTVLDGVRNPACGETPKPTDCFSENRATLHLHGGITPWISDGTPHQWTTPDGETTDYPQGVSVSNVPDMPDPGPGALTFFYTNQQSARLMFYHDHAWGITRLNVYAGEAAGYLLTDQTEQNLINGGALDGLGVGTPLVIQDKTFVSKDILKTDPTWDASRWGGEGSLWVPHVYMPAQNPGDPSGMSAFGRWMYGPWFWPPAKDAKYPPIANPYYDAGCDPNVILPDGSSQFCEPALIPSTPNVSVGMEAFADTPIVNGTAYPTTTVDPKAYRYRILNAANDRFWNLQWYVADPRTGTLSEVALKASEVAAAQTDPNVFPTPDTAISPAGPSWVQIGTEGGFLPTPVTVPNQPITWITDPTRFDVGNVDKHSLLLAPAERADVIVDFAAYRGKTLILYNDAPAAFPARVSSYDYYTGGPDLSPVGAPTTLPGYGPNTRTIMQVKVSTAAPETAFDRPNTTADRMGALMAAFGHHADGSGVFESGSDPIIVGQAAYNTAYGTSFVASGWCNAPGSASTKCDGYARIQEGSQPTDKFGFNTLAAPSARMQIPFQPKGMHDEANSASFDEWGRMTANLGLEAPGATPILQNIILYPYVNPATEILNASGMPSALDVTPISSAADGTQIWKITHNGVDTHPIHFHLYDVQVINRVTWDNIIIPPDPEELGWKDTVRVSPLEDTIVALRPIVPTLPFAVPDSKRPLNPMMPIGARGAANGVLGTEAGFNNTDTNGNPIAPIINKIVDFGWEYVFHCHILSHEEMDMMRPVTVHVPSALPAAPVLTWARGSVILTWTDGTKVDYLNPATWSNPNNEIGFKVERALVTGGVAGPYALIATALANATTYTDNPTDPTETYDYRVTAFNVAGDSPSNVITVVGLPKATTTVLTSSKNPSLVGDSVTFTATVSPAAATGTVTFNIDGVDIASPPTLVSGVATYTTSSLAAGPHPVIATYSGAPAYLASTSATLTQTVNKTATTTVVVSDINPSVVDQLVTFTATVSPAAATGTVEFFDGVTSLGTAPLASGVANLPIASLIAGTHSITAVYPGDGAYATSTSAAITQTVNKTATATIVVSDINPSVVGQLVTFTATVSPAAGTGVPTGTVTYNIDGVDIASPPTLVGGVATYKTTTLAAGPHPVIATYNGDPTYLTSTSPTITQVVNKTATATIVVSSINPSVAGQNVTFTATVSPSAATGSIDFSIDGASVGVVTLVAGQATFSTTSLAIGAHPVVATYSGDTAYLASTSPTLTQTVGPALRPTTTVVTSNRNPTANLGQNITFTATVTPVTGTGVPTGTVQFSIDGVNVGGALTLNAAGRATYSTAALSAGSHNVIATYSGSAVFAGGGSATFVQVVNQAASTTVVTSNRNPASVFGQSVTFTARVTPLAATGTVQFSVDGSPFGGPVTLNATGRATLVMTTLTVGTHTISAVYSGNVNYLPSSGSITRPVNKAASRTVVTTSGTPANFGTTVVFTATVTAVAPGAGIPTRTVQFRIDGVNVGSPLALNTSGQAAYSTNTLTVGRHTVSVVYSGDPGFNASTSANRNQRIR